jgi:hypothetical protein
MSLALRLLEATRALCRFILSSIAEILDDARR